MCVIATSRHGFKELPLSFWWQACAAFSHGLGLMYHDGRNLIARRFSRFNATTVLNQIEGAPKGTLIAIHLRKATAGAISEENLHPHVLSFGPSQLHRLAVMHNGTIHGLPVDSQVGPSDTSHFVQHWLRHRLSGDLERWVLPEVQRAIEHRLGAGNRMVILDHRGRARTFGRNEGFHIGQTWLSNPKVKSWLTLESEHPR